MKKLFVVIVLSVGMISASHAQQKIGYINTEELMGSMPETKVADAELQELQASLEQQGLDLQKELQEKDSAFVADSSKMNETTKLLKRNTLIELYQKVSGWQTYMQGVLQKASQEKVSPIRQKALDAIKTVAKTTGYTYIFEISSVIVGPPGDDVLGLVKKHLGIKDPAPAAPKAPAIPKQ
jgi:outer membrane protein